MDFSQIAVLIVGAAAAGVLARIVRQPLLVGYLFAGFALGTFGLAGESGSIEALGKVGVALLLFLVGLEMKLHELPTLGKIALITGAGQIVFTTIIGYIIALALGFESISALYIAIALAFSSTIIIVKLLSERRELSSLHGKIAVGFLLVQDFVAVLLLMFLAGVQKGDIGVVSFAILAVKGVLLLVAVWALSRRVIPRLFVSLFDTSTELVFIVSIAWALGLSALVGGPLGFSLEIGGFLAGLALSNLPEHLQVASRARPLRDFFLTIFFLILGTRLITDNIGAIIAPAVLLSIFVLIGNPLIMLVIMGIQGYRKHTSFMVGLTVAQISEFSLILVAMGVSVGHIPESVAALAVLVAVITMTVSTYMILGADKIYTKLKRFLAIFERKKTLESVYLQGTLSEHVVLVGCGRTGKVLLPLLAKKKLDLVVVDFDPEVITSLTRKKISCIFGDAADIEILESAKIGEASLIISTILNMPDNLALLAYLKGLKKKVPTVMKAAHTADAQKLYENGASYVIVPEVAAGEHIRHLVVKHGLSYIVRLRKGRERYAAKPPQK